MVTRGKLVTFTFPLFAIAGRLLKFSPIYDKFMVDTWVRVTSITLSVEKPGENLSERADQ
jgi:hypothetical protein